MKEILLITPPFTQLNTPYPATAYLTGFLNTKGIDSAQMDLGMEVILELFSSRGLAQMFVEAGQSVDNSSENAKRIYALRVDYVKVIDAVMLFLQGRNANLARQICTDDFLPQASRFSQLEELDWAFGNMGFQDRAKHLATLFLEDLSDFIVECVDENFGFSRYAERLGRSANSFDELDEKLNGPDTYMDAITLELLRKKLDDVQPKLVCFSVPFPGNLYSAFRCAQFIKSEYPSIKTAMGGGFPNTELRSVSDKRVFGYFDFITLDDGELPIELVLNRVLRGGEEPDLKRTFLLEDGRVVYRNNALQQDYKQSQVGTPDYTGLPLDRYISVIEIANPMHSLWSDGRWNKLTMAHGCYWGKCTFCDTSLDYIRLYEPLTAKLLVDRMEELVAQTDESGFHFVDEAAPPALMRELALEIIRRQLTVTWWTNIRFEKSFSKDLCRLLKASGCIAVSGGLEVASDRLLALIQKGVTVEQVAQVCDHFTEAGIMVHSYLMYGYPTQTNQETVDSLEMVRQLFELGVLQSGFWHQFALTAHSPVGLNPEDYGIVPQLNDISFANNDVDFKDTTGIDHGRFSEGLKKSLFNFMHGIGFDLPLQEWFEFKIPRPTIDAAYIEQALQAGLSLVPKPSSKILWLGNKPSVKIIHKRKKGKEAAMLQLSVNTKAEQVEVILDQAQGQWLLDKLPCLSPEQKAQTFAQLQADFEPAFGDLELFWCSKPMLKLREVGLLGV